jgi:hypothetical protein
MMIELFPCSLGRLISSHINIQFTRFNDQQIVDLILFLIIDSVEPTEVGKVMVLMKNISGANSVADL